MKKYFILFLLTISLLTSNAQSKGGWKDIPGFNSALPTTLTSQETFIGIIGLAALSYSLEEFVFKNHQNVNFYQGRIGMHNEYAWGLKNVWHQNFGVEHRVASWFSLSAEFLLQEWYDNTPGIESKSNFGIGTGIMTYYRWYIFGKKCLSPYIEYGTGIFMGFKEFPYNGTNFTFSHSSQLGLEYTLRNNNKVRLGYGNFHQSNYGWFESNPGYDGNGFSISFAWKMK